MSTHNSDLDDCVRTTGDVRLALEDVEQMLARQLSLRGTFVRRELIALVRRNEARSELLNQWIELYSTYMHWMRTESLEKEDPPPSRRRASSVSERAAEAARKRTNATDRRTTMEKAKTERAVIVTTEHRGVFFGYASDTDGEQIKLRNARLCLFWSTDVKGFMGLAGSGPTKKCRIGPPADITLRKITAVLECSPGAAEAWEQAPWSA